MSKPRFPSKPRFTVPGVSKALRQVGFPVIEEKPWGEDGDGHVRLTPLVVVTVGHQYLWIAFAVPGKTNGPAVQHVSSFDELCDYLERIGVEPDAGNFEGDDQPDYDAESQAERDAKALDDYLNIK